MSARPTRVVELITDLDVGGAERMLQRLLAHLDPARVSTEVVSMTEPGHVANAIEELGIVVHSLGMRSGIPDPRAIIRLHPVLRAFRPDVLHCWMHHANLLGGIVGTLTRTPTVWSIRDTVGGPSHGKRLTTATVRVTAELAARIPARIVSCSREAANSYERIGFPGDRIVVIPNGFDVQEHRTDDALRASIRRELDIEPDEVLVGMVARFAPEKDVESFVKAARQVLDRRPGARFLLCGTGMAESNAELVGWLREAGTIGRFVLVGPRDDVGRVMAGLDVLAMSSVSEAFPNVLGEAMARGITCVATDVGDASEIVGDTGRIVAPGSPRVLADALVATISLAPAERWQLGERARARIRERYEIGEVANRYSRLYEEVAHVRYRRPR